MARSPLQLFVMLMALLGLTAALAAYVQLRPAPTREPSRASVSPTRAAAPAPDSTRIVTVPGAPEPRARPLAPRFLVARVAPGSTVALRSRPSGPVLHRLGAKTEFGSPRVLSVVRSQRGRWLAVTAPELGNGRLGWVDARGTRLRVTGTRLALELDLSRRELVLRAGERVRRRMLAGVGAPGSSTPTGRFAVTDKLRGSDYSSVYGCCILALSGRQPNLPPGWTGGDRLAIHGTNDPGSIGRASSAGCPHASDRDLELLMRAVPLGTPVVIHS